MDRDLGKVERWGEGSEGRARDIGPVYSPDNVLKVTNGNEGGQTNFRIDPTTLLTACLTIHTCPVKYPRKL